MDYTETNDFSLSYSFNFTTPALWADTKNLPDAY